jgi:glutaryl-CoA dehydrogenase
MSAPTIINTYDQMRRLNYVDRHRRSITLGDVAMVDIDTSDRLTLNHLLDDDERVVLRTVREFMATEWALTARFPHERSTIPINVAPRLRGLWQAISTSRGYKTRCGSVLLNDLINMEIASTDASTAIFNNVHRGLAMQSIRLFGSDHQRARFLPEMTAYEVPASFAMPAVGRDEPVVRPPRLVAEPVGNDMWLLNGEAQCVGGVEPAAIRVVWASDRAGRSLNGFVVHEDLDGMRWGSATAVDRAGTANDLTVTFDNVEVLEQNRLPLARRWSHACRVIDANWMAIEWMAVGCASGAYSVALRHTRHTEFPRRAAINRAVVQQNLTAMRVNLSTAINRCCRISLLLERGATTSLQSNTEGADGMRRMKQIVELGARVVCTVNPSLDNDIRKFTVDSERIALYAASLVMGARRGRHRSRAEAGR